MYLPERNDVSWIDLTTLAVHLANGDTQFPFDDGEDDMTGERFIELLEMEMSQPVQGMKGGRTGVVFTFPSGEQVTAERRKISAALTEDDGLAYVQKVVAARTA